MQYTEDDLRDQLADAEDLPFGPVRTSTVEQIVAHADAGGLEDFALEARIELINAYHQGNEPAKEFSVFGWCLAYWDRHTDSIGRWEAEMLRWQYKWVVSSLTRFPTISLSQTNAALGDMEARFVRGGHSLHAVHSRRHSVAKHVGDLAEAGEQFRLWQAAPRDENSDCEGCDPELRVEWLMDAGRDADAMDVADSVLSGQLTCREQPASMLEVVMLAMARLGRIDDARSAHLRSYRAQRGDRDYLQEIGAHLRFLALTGNEARGLEVLERHIEWIDTPRDPMSLMQFATGAARLLTQVAELGHVTMTVHRPAFDGRPAADPTVPELQATMTELAIGLAAQFDQRNQTTQQSDRVRRLLAEPTTNSVPLDTPSSRIAAAPSAPSAAPGAAPVGARSPLEAIEAAEAQFDTEAAAALRAALVDGPAAGDPANQGLIQDSIGWLAIRDGDGPRAEAALGEAIAAYTAAGDVARAAAARSRLALSRADSGGEEGEEGEEGEVRALAAQAVATLAAIAAARPADDTAQHAMVMAYQRQADVLTRTGAADEALAVLETAAALDLADIRRAGVLRVSEAFATIGAGQADRAIEIAANIRAALLEAGHPAEAAGAGLLLAQLLRSVGHDEDAADLAAESVPALHRPPSPRRRAEVQQLLGSLQRDAGRLPEAIAAFREAVADFTAADAPGETAGAGYSLAECYHSVGRSLEAAELLEQYLPVYEAQGAPVATARTQLLLAQALSAIGESESAAARFASATDTLLEQEAWELAADAAMLAAMHSERDWDTPEAARRYGQAAVAFAQWGQPVLAARAVRRQAKMAMRSDEAQGRALFAEALALVQALPPTDGVDVGWELADWNDDLAWALWTADENEEALPYSATAEAGYTASGDAAGAGRSALFASQLRAEREDWAGARAHALRAHGIFEQGGLAEWVERAQAKLDELPEPD